MGLPVIYYCCSVQVNMDGSASLPLSNEITISGNSIQFLLLLLIVIGSDMTYTSVDHDQSSVDQVSWSIIR